MSADKSSNYYKLEIDEYKQLLQNIITSTYKKVNNETVKHISKEAQAIAQQLQVADRINTIARRDAYVTLKDHKPNFANHQTCRLINPAKSEIGKISKKILERINNNISKKNKHHTMDQHLLSTKVVQRN